MYYHNRSYTTLNFEANKKEISHDNMLEGYYNVEQGLQEYKTKSKLMVFSKTEFNRAPLS